MSKMRSVLIPLTAFAACSLCLLGGCLAASARSQNVELGIILATLIIGLFIMGIGHALSYEAGRSDEVVAFARELAGR